MAGEALDVFISYSRRDEGLKNELVNYHLKLLQREGKIHTWQDRDIEAGTEWATEIKTNLEKADIVLLLITRHFLASDYCYEIEMQRAVQRHHEGTARVIPIILEPCGWQYSDFSQLQVLPKDGKPVTRWDDKAEAFFDVEEGIRRVVDALNAARQQAAKQAQVEAERQRQQAAERLRQQQEAIKRQDREPKAGEQQLWEAVERHYEAYILRQQVEAERKELERQAQESAERKRQQPAEAEHLARERQKQLAEERQRQRETAAARKQSGQTGMGRRRALQIAGWGGGSLILAMGANSLRQLARNTQAETSITSDDLSPVEFEVVTVNEIGEVTDRQTKQAEEFQQDLGNGVTLNMVAIPAGEFVMGSPTEEEGRRDSEGPQRSVTVPKFFMGRFHVTQAQYEAVVGTHPSRYQGANRPVENVTWNDAVAFCEKLSEQTGRTYRLPSEAEWEYACRAGTTTLFHFGPTITTDLANYRGTDWEYEGNTYLGNYGQGPKGIFREETTDVGSFSANVFGLYDMHGNVWEWCQDVWHDNYESDPTDGSTWTEGGDQIRRVLRGGSWYDSPAGCRSAFRNWDAPDFFNNLVGFRVVCGGAR